MASIKYLVDLDLKKNQLLNAVVQNLAVAPDNPKDGQIYWDTVDKTLYVWKAYDPVPTSAPFGEWVDLGSSGITNLDYVAAETNGSVTSSTGNNAAIPLATLVAGTNKAGLLSPAEKTKLVGIEANAKDDQSAIEVPVSPAVNAKTNVQAALEDHETRITTATAASHAAVTLDSVVDVTAQAASLSGQQLTLKKATTSTDGVMSSEDKTKLDSVAANAQQNVATNLAAGTRTATAFPVTNSNGTGVTIPEASITEAGLLNATDKVKVNNAVLTTQSAITASFLSLSASLAENSDEKIASQKATKSYVDALVLSYGALVFQDGYDASTDTPKLDTTPFASGIKRGWTYAVSAAGDFFAEAVEAGDLLVARQDSPTTRAHWVVINKNIPDVLSTLLVGFVVGANSTITSSDSILVAFGKIQGQLNNKEGGITAGTTSQYFRGDKTFQELNKAAVGLANAENTSDLNKPISTATQTALNTKIAGSGTTNRLAKFTASGAVGNSVVTELANGYVGINQPTPTEILDVVGNGKFSGSIKAVNSKLLTIGGGVASLADVVNTYSLKLEYNGNPGIGTYFGALSNGGGVFQFLQSANQNGSTIYPFLINPFGGNVGINQPTPTEILDVVGNGKFTGQIKSTIATGTAPLVVASTTKVSNLNADLLDGLDSSDFYSSTNPSSFTGKVVSVSSSTSLVSTFAIAHTFGTDVIATSKFVSDNSVFLCEVIMTNNLVTFNVNTPIAANSVKFIIIG